MFGRCGSMGSVLPVGRLCLRAFPLVASVLRSSFLQVFKIDTDTLLTVPAAPFCHVAQQNNQILQPRDGNSPTSRGK